MDAVRACTGEVLPVGESIDPRMCAVNLVNRASDEKTLVVVDGRVLVPPTAREILEEEIAARLA